MYSCPDESRRALGLCAGGSDVEQMADGQVGMAKGHAGAGVTHDRADLLTHIRAEAVDSALRTGRFLVAEAALLDAPESIFEQYCTVVAEAGDGS